jgi:hypothetical protein
MKTKLSKTESNALLAVTPGGESEFPADGAKYYIDYIYSNPTGANFYHQLVRVASRILNIGISDIIKSKRGKGGGTYGHKQIAVEYAQYLDEHLAVLVNEVFFQRIEEEKNPDLIADRAIATYKSGRRRDFIRKSRLRPHIRILF